MNRAVELLKPIATRRRVTALLVVLVVVLAGCWWFRDQTLPFDSKQWQDAETIEAYEVRFKMVPSVRQMMDRGQLNQRTAIRQALGKPESEVGDVWLYCLGTEHASMFPADRDWLELTFDAKGTLVSHRVRPD